MTIEIQVQADDPSLVDVNLLQQAIECVLAAEQVTGDVTVLITDDETVAKLNQDFLDRSGPTDVLSFPTIDDNQDFVLPPEESTDYLGDIVIALPYTQRQAQQLGRPLSAELALLCIHGVLHLLGYDHATPDEQAEMWRRQDAIMSGLGLPAPND